MKRREVLSSMSPCGQSRLPIGMVFLLAVSLLGGCVPFWKKEAPPVSAEAPIKPHETWCYKTMGETECFAGPQNLPPENLVMVDPPSRYPLTREAYQRVLAEAQGAAKTKEISDASIPIPLALDKKAARRASGPTTPPGDMSVGR